MKLNGPVQPLSDDEDNDMLMTSLADSISNLSIDDDSGRDDDDSELNIDNREINPSTRSGRTIHRPRYLNAYQLSDFED